MVSATYEKASGLNLKPAVKTIGELTTDDICTYVTIENVTVTDVYDNDGTYSTPNITVTDGTDTIQLYKAVVDKDSEGAWSVKVGDTITITAAVGVFKETLQLRNTSADEIVTGQPGEPEPATITIAQALAAADGTEDLTVKGVVTLIDGKNVYLGQHRRYLRLSVRQPRRPGAGGYRHRHRQAGYLQRPAGIGQCHL